MRFVRFSVTGIAQPQGSVSFFNGRATSANAKLKPWRRAVTKAAKVVFTETIEGAVSLELEFRLPRPQKYATKKWFERKNLLHTVRPDLDKLTRAICDALTDAEIWEDDSRVCEIKASKFYVDQGDSPGVSILVRQV